MEEPILPNEILLDDNAVIVLWGDGHRSLYSHRYLRLRCPCASCVDEMTGQPRLDPNSVSESVRAVDQLPVGNYGVQFLWSDTHYTGIYTYQVLRAACPCIICGEARASVRNPNGGAAEQSET